MKGRKGGQEAKVREQENKKERHCADASRTSFGRRRVEKGMQWGRLVPVKKEESNS
jgi:hypothetical protein